MKRLSEKIVMVDLSTMILVWVAGCAGATTEAVTSLGDDEILYFWYDLTFEQRAEYSKEWIPKVEEELKVNPEYRGFHYYETRHVYGVPDESCITQETAYRIAAERIGKEFGIVGVPGDDVYYYVYFDITDHEMPLWKMYIGIDEIDPWRFIWVEIDAKQGEVKKILERGNRMEYYEFM